MDLERLPLFNRPPEAIDLKWCLMWICEERLLRAWACICIHFASAKVFPQYINCTWVKIGIYLSAWVSHIYCCWVTVTITSVTFLSTFNVFSSLVYLPHLYLSFIPFCFSHSVYVCNGLHFIKFIYISHPFYSPHLRFNASESTV